MYSIVKSARLIFLLYPIYANAQQSSIEPDDVYGPVVITADNRNEPDNALLSQRVTSSDSATLLQDVPGLSLYGAGGISSLPAIHGLADDRVRIQIDGMDLMPSCPNHMNSPLSVFDPTTVGNFSVMAGITPVSAGGDSIAGTIRMTTAQPEFATSQEQSITTGQIGSFYRSNGDAHGASLSMTYATETVSLTYSGSVAQSNDVSAAGAFKAAGYAAPGRAWLAGEVIGSTAYKAENNRASIALLNDKNALLEFSASQQTVPVELYPTQRMDMTRNLSTQFNLHYRSHYQWGELDARAFEQITHHAMDFGEDKQFQYGAASGMPMNTEGKTRGVSIEASVPISEQSVIKLGSDYLIYQLNDWWPAATATTGMMGPSTFLNVNDGQRTRTSGYAEVATHWSAQWLTEVGLRSELVSMNTGNVQGYNNMPLYGADAAAFNATDHQRSDHMIDMSMLARYFLSEKNDVELGYAEKNRAPNLYERYTWSAANMAAIMNNFIGDGNGYIGNPYLRPEVAHTISATWDSHDPGKTDWRLTLTPYFTYVTDFIDAQRCPLSFSNNCSAVNLNATTGFVTLQYVNQNAQIYGADISGFRSLGNWDGFGEFAVNGVMSYARGENVSSKDNLYNIMPLNAKLALQQKNRRWQNRIEWQMVAAKTDVSQVRNENKTAGYGLLNFRSSYQWKKFTVDAGVENLLNRFYDQPLGGAYVGQGSTMGINSIPWGVQVPGKGRSINVAFNVEF